MQSIHPCRRFPIQYRSDQFKNGLAGGRAQHFLCHVNRDHFPGGSHLVEQ